MAAFFLSFFFQNANFQFKIDDSAENLPLYHRHVGFQEAEVTLSG